MRIDPERFWQQPDSWPLDTSGYVFLGRAVLRVAAAQIVPREPVTFPFSDRAKATYEFATDRIAKGAATGVLKTAILTGSQLHRMMPTEWVTLDRKAIFKRLHLTEATAYGPSSYREVSSPIYIEEKSLSAFIEWTATMAKAAEAAVAFARVDADRYRFEDQPDLLPPVGFISINEALAHFSQDGLGPVATAKELRRKLHSGEVEAILQFWESGAIFRFHASDWGDPEARLAFTDNGTVAIPDIHGRDGAYSSWAYVRVRLAVPPPATANNAERQPTLEPEQGAAIPLDRNAAPNQRGERRRSVEAVLAAEFGPGLGKTERDYQRALDAVARWRRANPSAHLPRDERRTITRIWKEAL